MLNLSSEFFISCSLRKRGSKRQRRKLSKEISMQLWRNLSWKPFMSLSRFERYFSHHDQKLGEVSLETLPHQTHLLMVVKICTNETIMMHIRQRNYSSSLFRKWKKNQFYRNLDIKDVSDNNKFWKTIKPLFLDKTKSSNTMVRR